MIAGGIFYLFKRRRTTTTQNDQIITQDKPAAPVRSRDLSEMEEVVRAQELGGADYFIPELEHRVSPVELQASRFHH